jgi:small conductance mechanosensitive channel
MVPALRSDWDEIEQWLDDHGSDILITIALLFIAYLIFRAVVPRIVRAAMMRGAHPPDEETTRRADTILGVIDGSARVAVLLLAIVTILPEFGVNITAIVTGLGITGLAVALGSQQLVRDALNGIFLLAEDQYRQGDVVTIAGVTGTVEQITLRRTIVRDDDGVVHNVPNGSINVVSNHTRDYAQVNVAVVVSYGEDLAKVTRVVEEVGNELRTDDATKDAVLEPLSVRGVESVGDAGVTVTVSARTRPAARWDISRELRRRLADAFVREGIRVPFATVDAEEPS